ncbi:MAG: PIN domain-containing protein [Proteobacteria bacterium]|nr:PIN domain-containing protein [Pseudomonadota bacterium]
MILLDVNLLLYAQIESAAEHVPAKAWLERQFAGGMRIGLPWHSLLGFARLASNPRMYARPLPAAEAWRVARLWLAGPNVWVPEATERHAETIGELLATPGIGMRDVMDVHLAALAIEHGLVLCSNDSGFARFKRLRWMNPLDV